MAAAKADIYFFIVFLRQTSAVHFLLGYRIHFTDHSHIFGVGELIGPIRKAPQAIVLNRKRYIQDGGCQNGSTCISASMLDSNKINLVFRVGKLNDAIKRLDVEMIIKSDY
jgi:hypothetical protein